MSEENNYLDSYIKYRSSFPRWRGCPTGGGGELTTNLRDSDINPIDPSKPVQLLPVAIPDFSEKFEPYQPRDYGIQDAVVKQYDQALEGKQEIITGVLSQILGHPPTREDWKELHLHLVSENFTNEKTSVKAEFYFQGILLGTITSYINTSAGKAGVIFTPAPAYDGKFGS